MKNLKKCQLQTTPPNLNLPREENNVSNEESSDSDEEEESSQSCDDSDSNEQSNAKPVRDPTAPKGFRKSSSDISDSETDMDKPPKKARPHVPNTSITNVKFVPKNNAPNRADDSGENSEESEMEQLSQSILQIPGLPKSTSKKVQPPSSLNLKASQKTPEGEVQRKMVERRQLDPEMSSPDDPPPIVEGEYVSPVRPADRLNSSQSSYLGTTPFHATSFPSFVAGLSEHYTKLSTPLVDICPESNVWVLQIPRYVSASDLIGQRFPTKLRGKETIASSSSPMMFKEQPFEQLKRPLNCLTSAGNFSYKMQVIQPEGFWTLRPTPLSEETPTTTLPWGVSVAPIPVEELMRMKSARNKSHEPPRTPTRNLNLSVEDSRPKKRPRDERDDSIAVKSQKKKKLYYHKEESSFVEEDSINDKNAMWSKKRKISSSEAMPALPAKKKKKHSEIEESNFGNFNQNNSSFSYKPKLHSPEKQKGEMAVSVETKKKKHKRKSSDFSNSLSQDDLEKKLNKSFGKKQDEHIVFDNSVKMKRKEKSKHLESEFGEHNHQAEIINSIISNIVDMEKIVKKEKRDSTPSPQKSGINLKTGPVSQNVTMQHVDNVRRKKKKHLGDDIEYISQVIKVESTDDVESIFQTKLKKKKHKNKEKDAEKSSVLSETEIGGVESSFETKIKKKKHRNKERDAKGIF